MPVKIDILKSNRGGFCVWEPPMEDGHYILGADIAQGSTFGKASEKGDSSTFCVLKRIPGGVVQVAEGRSRMEVFAFADVCAAFGHWYNFAMINIERNLAHAAIAALRSCGYPQEQWYVPPLVSSIYEAQNSQYFFHKNVSTQKALIDTMLDYVDPEAPKAVIRSQALLSELASLQRDGLRGTVSTNGKDLSIAFAMAIIVDFTSPPPDFMEKKEKTEKMPAVPRGADPQIWKELHAPKKLSIPENGVGWGVEGKYDQGFPEWCELDPSRHNF